MFLKDKNKGGSIDTVSKENKKEMDGNFSIPSDIVGLGMRDEYSIQLFCFIFIIDSSLVLLDLTIDERNRYPSIFLLQK